ncbi:signal recognition particle-docking protein FtsY [Streptococcus entericus]|uniref:signal recognition particle-docking protein FtsY n=1 Tax=Streptococcus entericus TaxID=155680 RepID=UPI00035D7402|nr:signal recognition particle-docking protein FtsY [Streptococcus entericus]
MGLFDRLFGKKKEEQVLQDPVQETTAEDSQLLDEPNVDVSTVNTAEENTVMPQADQFVLSEQDDLANERIASSDAERDTLQASQPALAPLVEPTVVQTERQDPTSLEQGSLERQAEALPVDMEQEIGSALVSVEPVSDSKTDELTEQMTQSNLADEVVLSQVDDEADNLAAPADQLTSPLTDAATLAAQLTENSQHFSSVMADYYAKKAAVKAAAERGEELVLESMQTRQVQEPIVELAQPESHSETTEDKYHRTLKKTRTGFGARLNAFLANFRTVDEEFFEDLEELLIMSDVGVTVATKLTEELRYEAKLEKAKKPDDLRRVIIEKLVDIYEKDGFEQEAINFQKGLTVMLFVGVNGVGKTTSIGKLAYQYKRAGKSVMLVAADTFRAGAVAQLVEWGRRVDVPVVTGPEKADPASVVFDGMEKAVAEAVDILLIDTAGRLQNKDHLMAELEKIGRIIKRVLPDAPHETLLALDASTGQNALVQAKEFSKITPLTGLVLTKLDGTAKGGVVLAIREELDIPVKFIGFGEKIDDIGQFRSEDFMRGLLDGLV